MLKPVCPPLAAPNRQNADHWYHNIDKLIHYVNINASRGGPVAAMYSTPTHYTAAKRAENFTWEVRQDDIFPLADDSHNYWSGYFTSRPALKRQVRVASNLLNAARQLEVVSGVNKSSISVSTIRPSPVVGGSWTDSFEGTVGVATHHDGMSGTERQDVTDDYSQRISESHEEVEQGVAMSLARMMGAPTTTLNHCNCNQAGDCLNMSVCSHTTGEKEFTMVAWNPLGQPATSWLRLPVTGANWTVTALGDGATVPSETRAIDGRTLELPLLYLNEYQMTAKQIAAAKQELANNATHVIAFQASLPPFGHATYQFTKSPSMAVAAQPTRSVGPGSVSNGHYTVAYDASKGVITGITNEKANISTAFSVDWGFYKSSTGGCTGGINATSGKYQYDLYGCSGQKSGAYM